MWNDDIAAIDEAHSLLGLISLRGAADRLGLSDERMEVLAMEGRFRSLRVLGEELAQVLSQDEIDALLRDPVALTALRRRPRRPRRCPECSEQRWVPIVYGMPPRSCSRRADRGEVALGGCGV